MVFGENGYWEKWKFGRIDIREMDFQIRQIWKNENQEKMKILKM